MLGTGVYFADNFMKSLGYCHDSYMSAGSPYKIMLLCEVALGRIQTFSSSQKTDSALYDSVQALGQQVPDPFNTVFDKNGVSFFFFLKKSVQQMLKTQFINRPVLHLVLASKTLLLNKQMTLY